MLELMLAIALISVIVVVGIVSGTSAGDRRKFQYAVDRLATTLRMARAEAANKARRMRLTFDPETGRPDLLWEPLPLTEPQIFERYTSCSWLSKMPNELISVTRCRLTGPDGKPVDEAPTGIGDEDESESQMQSITFAPDGTSDSVLIELESADLAETLRAAIKLDGENSLIKTKFLYGHEAEDDEEDPFAEDEENS